MRNLVKGTTERLWVSDSRILDIKLTNFHPYDNMGVDGINGYLKSVKK